MTALNVTACQDYQIDFQSRNQDNEQEVVANNSPTQKTYQNQKFQNQKFGFSFACISNYILENQPTDFQLKQRGIIL